MEPVAELSDTRSPVIAQAEVLERTANAVLFLAVLVTAFSIFGGVLALTNTDGSEHPYLGFGWICIGGGTLFGGAVAMLAVWAKTYAAVVTAGEPAR